MTPLLVQIQRFLRHHLTMPRLPLSHLDRYIMRELWHFFGLGVGLFTAIGLWAGVLFDLMRDIADTQLPLGLALQILGWHIPYVMSLAFPIAVLFASLLSVSRLSSDGELLALQACGVSLSRLVCSVLLFGVLITGLTFIFTEAVVPTTRHQAKLLWEQPLSAERSSFQDHHIVYREYGGDHDLQRLFYAQEFEGHALKNLTILDLTHPASSQVISAESATWNSAEQTWIFNNGTLYTATTDGADQPVLGFKTHRLPIPANIRNLKIAPPDASTMSIAAARQALAVSRESEDTSQMRQLAIQIQRKVAVPVMAVIFGLVGSTLGLQPRRLTTSAGFGLSVLIVLGYYCLALVTDLLGHSGALSPWLAAWLPNLVLLGIGIGLLVKATR